MWIEILLSEVKTVFCKSRPARALWIEILTIRYMIGEDGVEAREGLVD